MSCAATMVACSPLHSASELSVAFHALHGWFDLDHATLDGVGTHGPCLWTEAGKACVRDHSPPVPRHLLRPTEKLAVSPACAVVLVECYQWAITDRSPVADGAVGSSSRRGQPRSALCCCSCALAGCGWSLRQDVKQPGGRTQGI